MLRFHIQPNEDSGTVTVVVSNGDDQLVTAECANTYETIVAQLSTASVIRQAFAAEGQG